eukprot:CAMPEP_0182866446 /NCGR_PEP_ID=MMETSP0034_2-20130328/8210_1 /TAXON_ID=156128 /ORGANISM="Nephroselmis pyriformis, Strain CCMP717" /LENGTH=250 /DNA_ID=CAMNT_0024998773 /DNA_START=10 /DNA_END=762 /DNA_ORIENTATION=-
MASLRAMPLTMPARVGVAGKASASIAKPASAFLGSRMGLGKIAAPVARGAMTVTRAAADTEGDLSDIVVIAAPAAALAVSVAFVGSHTIDQPLIDFVQANGVPVISELGLPDFAIRWFHAINMSIVLGAMGGYGTYLGWKVRAGNGSDDTFGTPFDASTLHPLLMAAMTFFFTAGALGGVTFETVEGRAVLESPHAISAFAGLGLLVGQGILGVTMGGSQVGRNTHAVLGTAIMALFVVHAGLGLQLGLN